MNEGMYTELDGDWHIIKSTSHDSNTWTVETECGIVAPWNQTFVDQMPAGGSEGAHDACIAATEPKATTKKK